MKSFIHNTFFSTILSIGSNKQLFFLSVTTNFIAFFVLGLFSLLFVNLNTLLSTWDKHVQLIIYLDDKISIANNKKIELLFKANKNIDSVVFTSRDQAWKLFQNDFSSSSKFITSLEFNPLPASYTIKFLAGINRLENIRKFSELVNSQKGVESIEYGEKWISKFEQFMIFLRGFIITFGALLFSGMILIIANTIKLSIYSRKDEIDLMSFLGATNSYIRTPLLLEGLLQGLFGALLALSAVKLVHLYIIYRFKGTLESILRSVDFYFLTNSLAYSIIVIGCVIGILGSLLSVNQFLDNRNLE